MPVREISAPLSPAPDSPYVRDRTERKIMSSLMATLFVAGLFGTLARCNTMKGAGKDIQQGGKAITDEAREQNR